MQHAVSLSLSSCVSLVELIDGRGGGRGGRRSQIIRRRERLVEEGPTQYNTLAILSCHQVRNIKTTFFLYSSSFSGYPISRSSLPTLPTSTLDRLWTDRGKSTEFKLNFHILTWLASEPWFRVFSKDANSTDKLMKLNVLFFCGLLKVHKHEFFFDFFAETETIWSQGPVTRDF